MDEEIQLSQQVTAITIKQLNLTIHMLFRFYIAMVMHKSKDSNYAPMRITSCWSKRSIHPDSNFSSWGQHGAHLGPVGPRWTPCWPHEPCNQGHSPPGKDRAHMPVPISMQQHTCVCYNIYIYIHIKNRTVFTNFMLSVVLLLYWIFTHNHTVHINICICVYVHIHAQTHLYT